MTTTDLRHQGELGGVTGSANRADRPSEEGQYAGSPVADLGAVPAHVAPTNGKVDPATV